ncbi:MAG: hypothetical protein ACXAAQ_06585 [Candidatus Thorarchaeota archaeon]|jgi:hypothetical protein
MSIVSERMDEYYLLWLHEQVRKMKKIERRNTSILVNDRSEQLPALVSQASMIQTTLLREFRKSDLPDNRIMSSPG